MSQGLSLQVVPGDIIDIAGIQVEFLGHERGGSCKYGYIKVNAPKSMKINHYREGMLRYEFKKLKAKDGTSNNAVGTRPVKED